MPRAFLWESSTVYDLSSLHPILGYVISCRNSFFLEGEIIENAWTHFPRGPIRLEWNMQEAFLIQRNIKLKLIFTKRYFKEIHHSTSASSKKPVSFILIQISLEPRTTMLRLVEVASIKTTESRSNKDIYVYVYA